MNVGYVRLSRDDDKRNYVSIENQMLIIRQYAAERNIVVDRWYEDDGVSGYIFDRPGFNQLMEDLDKDIDRVFVKDFSRLGRHNAKVLLLLDEFQERGKQLIVIDDAYDSLNSDDDTIGIKTWYNERYVKDTSKKIRRALGARQKEGTLMTQPPFGYKRNEKNKAIIEIVPKEAEYIKMVYDLYLKGSGYRKIATYLTENHVPTPSMIRHERELEEGRSTKRKITSEWSDGMVKDILDNDFYIGTFRLHKRERVTIHGKDRRVPKENQSIFENHHPPIIDKMTFDLVQEVKAKRVKNHYRGSRGQWVGSEIPNPFGSCLFCKDCGSRLTPIVRKTSSRERKYYICSTYNTKGRRHCSKAHLIEEQDLMEDVVNYIRLCRDSLQEMIAAYDMKDFEAEKKSVEEKRSDIQQMISEQKKQLKTLFSQKVKDLAVSPDNEEIIHETYASLQQDILANIHGLELKLEELNHTKLETADVRTKLRTALEVVDDIIQKGILDRKDIEILIERIVVDENGLPEIALKYGLSGLIQYSPADELNRRENAILYTTMKLILEDERGYTSAKYLSAKLTDAGYKKSKRAVLPYIGFMIDKGMIEPSDNPLKPYTIVKTPDEIKEIMANFSRGIPSDSSYDQNLHLCMVNRRNA
jgi:site-specific DNA recombinase